MLGLPLPWSPSHRLMWVPDAGVVRAWDVRLIRAGEVTYAQTRDEHQQQLPPRWIRVEVSGTWTWDGCEGYKGEPGFVRLDGHRD